jgi:hypothetical protein
MSAALWALNNKPAITAETKWHGILSVMRLYWSMDSLMMS